MGDMDGGEMFNNFMLHPDEIPLHGVEISEKLGKKLGWCGKECCLGIDPRPTLRVTNVLAGD
jgi:hypothetical protein